MLTLVAIAVVAAAIADAWTTHRILRSGRGHEANPIVRAFGVERHPQRIYAVKLVAAAIVIAAIAAMPARYTLISGGVVVLAWGGAAVWNARLMLRLR